ncbi:MAG TPA: PKD domain-containing protein, partial [Myxococcales bacterium]|nr:PKD domain-containing protein [Myxococcales bacterium]
PGSHAFGPLDQGYFVFNPGVQFQSPGTITLAAADGTLSANVPVQVLGPDQVRIVDDASRFAVAGAPYRYSSTGAVTAVSTAGPPRFQTCPPTPPGFDVDPESGVVDWTPSAPGMVSVCVQANAGFGPQDVLTYTIDVAPGPRPGPPDAGFVVRPPQSAPGAFVVLDPRGTRSQVGPPIFRWRFGDGAWPSTDPKPFHRYLLPGGYRPHLTVWDGAGQSATADRPLQVGSAIRLPPTVRISSAQPLQGRDWLDATLSAEVTQGTGPSPGLVAFRWDLGDGTSHSGTLAAGQTVPDAPAGYGPGRYFAQLLVLDGNGMTASDKVEVVVTRGDEQPPDCLATVEPTALFLSGNIGRAAFRAFQLPGTARLIDPVWTIDGQPSSGPVAGQTYDAGGWHDGALVVRDEAGLLCKDQLELAVIPSPSTLNLPPRIIHPGGGTATCGKALEGEAPVVADPAGLGVTWSLAVASPGGAVDSEGRLSWTPPAASSAPGSFVLVATGAAGSDRQAISVPVECPDSRELGTTCGGCGAGGGSPLLALAASGLLARARRRPTASRRPAAPPR